MSRKHLDTAHETRMWLQKVIVPLIVAAVPAIRSALVKKVEK